jgi:hypothetical protein
MQVHVALDSTSLTRPVRPVLLAATVMEAVHHLLPVVLVSSTSLPPLKKPNSVVSCWVADHNVFQTYLAGDRF